MKSIKTSLPLTGYWDTRQGGRLENQDACGFIDTPLGLIAVVCDGMGGGPSGKLAASVAVQKIVEYVMNAPEDASRKEVMKDAVEYAHKIILKMGIENPSLKGMGTTVAAVLINSHSAIVCHVGDSRVYQFRWGRKIFRTQDHSMVAELVRNKTLTEEQARLSSQSNLITKALGGQLSNLADVTELSYESGDRFLLCTDGIWGMMPEKDLIHKIAKTPSISGAVDSTILFVDSLGRKSGNTHDNMTIAILGTKQDSILKEKMNKRTIRIILGLLAIGLISIITNIVLISKLSQPSLADQEVQVLKEQSKEKDSQIEKLRQQIKDLNDEVTNLKHETADAKLEVAAEQEKAAKRALEEAENQANEAEAATQKAITAEKMSKSFANDANKRIQSVIQNLTMARDKNSRDRKPFIESAIKELNILTSRDSNNKNIYLDVSKQLNYGIAYKNTDQAKGHYNHLIKKMKSIK